jgi:hypothetical protein
MKLETTKYAEVSWCVFDIHELRPNWTVQECASFLSREGRHIQDAMVSAGWSAIEDLLPSKQD